MPASIPFPTDLSLFSLDIEGNNVNSQLKANQHQILGRGSRQYCLDRRKEILERRGMAVPETWDLNWTAALGAKWHPGLINDSNLLLWSTVTDDYIVTYDDAGTTRVSDLKDRSGYGHTFSEVLGSGPELNLSDLNGFNGMLFTGDGGTTGEYLLHTEDANDLFDVGLGDFCCFIMFNHGPDNNDKEMIFSNGNPVFWGIQKDFVSTNENFNNLISNKNNNATASWTGGNRIIQAGRFKGDALIRADGGVDETTTIDTVIANKSIANTQGMFLGRKSASAADYFGGTIYEVMYFKSWPQNNVRDKIEGYLAHKYGIEGILPTSHLYKIEPPRQEVS